MLSKKVLSLLLCSAILQSTATLTAVSVSAEEIEYSQSGAYVQEIADNATLQTIINVSVSEINSRGFESAVQSALNNARDNATDSNIYKIVVPKGSYIIKNGLKIYSNTYLTLTGVTLTRSTDSVANMIRTGTTDSASSGVTGYSAYRNITVDGGILNGSATRNTMVKFAHGTNISIINTTMRNVNNGHIMEVAGIDGFTVKNCSFSDQTLDSALIGYEALQLDVLVQSHFVGYRSEDIPMKNVLIEGCSFKNCPRGIGSHTAILNNPFNGVKIKNCTFEDMGSVAIQGQNWVNCEITGNTINNAPRGIAVYSTMEKGKGTYTSSTLANEGNTVSHVSNSYIPMSNHNIVISDNIIKKCGFIQDVYAKYDCGGISVIGYDLDSVHSKNSDGSGGLPIGNYYVKGVTIKNNTIDTKGHGVRLVDTKTVAVTENTIKCLPNEFDTAKYHGIYVFGAEADSITKNSISNATINGIYVYNQSNVAKISNNNILNANNYGISIDKSKATSINYNTVNTPKSNGIHITNGSTIFKDISNNSVYNSGYHGIGVVGASNGGTISYNTITNPAKKTVSISGDSTATVGTNYTSAVSSISLNKTSLTLEIGESYTLTTTISPSDASANCTWLSSDTRVATVTSNGNVIAKGEGTTTITVQTSNGKTATCIVAVEKDTSTVALNKASITLGIGETYTLTKTVTPANTVCTFSSSDTSVASVDSNGKITTKKAGVSNITVMTAKGKTATCIVTVKNAPASIALNKTSIMLGVGETFDLNSSLPKNTASYSIKYSSNSTEIASVAEAGGIVTAKNAGTAIITATTYNGKTATCTVTVKNAPTKIALNRTSIALGVGEIFDLNSSIPNGTASYNVKYSSDSTDVASVVSTGGIVTAKKAGTATITATTYNGKTATCIVTVKNAPSKIALNKTIVELGVGETFALKTFVPSNAASFNIKYSSNNTSVASVASNSGMITAKATGTAIITATTYNGIQSACTVVIKNAPDSITLNKTNITLGVGESIDLNSTLPSGTASYSVKYSSNRTSVASATLASGIITTKKPGTAIITATTHNGKKATCTITVKDAPSSISLNETSITLRVGETFKLNSILPSDTASYSIKYTSNSSRIAGVSLYSGLITAKKAGTAIITAKTYNEQTATCTVLVE
ncbi:MAG: Ig-like domain-containing protein [Acutalibacteraceae bacterium]|nr:Ig-like domain-containing protein [Acutalibacteraceae bacterium]